MCRMINAMLIVALCALLAVETCIAQNKARLDSLRIPDGILQGLPTGAVIDTSSDLTPLHIVQPKYPKEAAKRRLEGSVTIQALVDTGGSVRRVVVLKSTAEEFNQSVIEAVMQWKYTPARRNGIPINAWMILPPFNFQISKKQQKSRNQQQ
jgi:TonB family protein